jgi:predicted protein tyrosine phosphatase
MDIFIHPRIEISKIAPSKPYAVISITDEGNDFAPIFVSPNLKDVLRCHFDDIAQHYPGYTVFDAAMAARIWAFVDQLESIEELHINCEAGRSRSAAVAAAICLYKNGVGSDSWVWNEQWRFGIFKRNYRIRSGRPHGLIG